MYAEHYPRLVRALEIAGAGRAAAEDVAQEAFARTLGHWWRVRGGSNPPGYVYRTAFRLGRKTITLGSPLEEEGPAAPRAREDVETEAVVRVDVEAALAAMPARRRACAVLCLIGGCSPKEAGKTLGIAEGTVRKQVERARNDLRLALEVSR